MPIACSSFVDWFSKLKEINNSLRAKIKMCLHSLKDQFFFYFCSSEILKKETHWLFYSNCIANLQLTLLAKSARYNIFSKISCHIGCTSINLGWILPRESSSTVSSHTTITIYNDFSPSQSTISDRTSNIEASSWIDMNKGLLIHKIPNNWYDHLLFYSIVKLFLSNIFAMLRRNHNSCYSFSFSIFIFYTHLSFPIRTKEWKKSAFSNFG